MRTKQLYVVTIGNPFDGMRLVGPFDDGEAANEYADNHQDDWWVVKLDAPATDGEES